MQVEFQEAINWKLQYDRDTCLNSVPLIHLISVLALHLTVLCLCHVMYLE